VSFETMAWTHAGFDLRLEPYKYGPNWGVHTITGVVQVSSWEAHELERAAPSGYVDVAWPAALIDREFGHALVVLGPSCSGAVSARRRWSVRFTTVGSANEPLSAVMRLNWLAEQLAAKKYAVLSAVTRRD